jgi:hypothetical protein
MKMKIDLSQSVYANSSSGTAPGLRIEGGRLINDRPDSRMGIQKMADARRMMKHDLKVQTYAEGYVRGERMEEMNKMMSSMMGGCGCGKPNCGCDE